MFYDSKIKYLDNNKLNNDLCEVECICEVKSYISKTQIIQCFLCHKYQHITCIYQAKYIKPYICFNCQFRHNHFYLRWKKTILPAKEIIYQKKWAKKQTLLTNGTKTFKFSLNLNELYRLNQDKEKNSSHYLAFIWLTNNGKPFTFGFPDNINIKINGKDFYSTETKGFKYPLLLSLENTYSHDYTPKKKHLITMENYEIPHASEFFTLTKSNRLHIQNVTISFEHPLENYYGSEFQFEDIRRYLFYIGVFQEIKIPALSLVKNSNKLIDLNSIFRDIYNEKVLKLNNIININMNEGEEINNNMNFKSYISGQKIISPIRGIFCQHTEVLDFGECCRYITSKNQIYKCNKCNKPLNIMYIDYNSEKIFEENKNKGFDEIYFDNKFQFIKGIKENNENKNNNIININEISDSSDFVSDSFYEYHKKELDEINKKEEENNVCEIIDSSEENNNLNNDDNNEENVIELDETISLNSDSSNNEDKKDDNNFNNNNKNINNLQLNNKTYKIPKKINYLDKNKLIDLKMEMNMDRIKERIKKEFLQRKRNYPSDSIKSNNKKKNIDGEEVIDISSQNSINESSNFIPIDNEFVQQFSTNSN
jgi:hypothetical protein